MSVPSMDLLDLAKSLADDPVSEAHHRSGASRGYYAAYLAAEQLDKLLRLPEPAGRRQGVHEMLIRRLNAHGFQEVAARLRDAKNIRRDADYKVSDDFSRDQALESVLSSELLTIELAQLHETAQIMGYA